MLRNQHPAEQTVGQAVRATRDHTIELTRDELNPCAIVGDPSGFIVSLEAELGRMRRHSDSSCLLMVTPDANVGIRAMDGLGARLAANFRSYDSLCRYGARQFLVLLPHVLRENAPSIVRRLRVQVVGYPLTLVGGTEAFVTATIGGAMLEAGSTMNENIDRAVMACKVGKKRGGDTDQMWSPSLEAN